MSWSSQHKGKNAKNTILRQSNMAAAAARSQRLKQNHEKETTATRTTEITSNFFFHHSDWRTSFLFVSRAGFIAIPPKLFPQFGNEKTFPSLWRFQYLSQDHWIYSREQIMFSEGYLLWQLFLLKRKVLWMKEQRRQHCSCYPEVSIPDFLHQLGFFLPVLW